MTILLGNTKHLSKMFPIRQFYARHTTAIEKDVISPLAEGGITGHVSGSRWL